MSKTLEITYSKSYELPGFWEKIGVKEEMTKQDTIESVLDAVSKRVQTWHEKNNPDFYKHVDKKIKTEFSVSTEDDKEWEDIKIKLGLIKFREEAQEYIDTTNYHMALGAKKLINQKPLKNKQ